MRPNRYIILISALLGVFGIWFSADAVGQYLNTVRSFSSVELRYEDGSFAWQDPEHLRATAEFVVRNDSENDARLSYLGLNLYFDGEFAGAFYDQWEPVDIPAGEAVAVELPFIVSIERMRAQGSEAELSVRGEMRMEFEGIQRDMTLRAAATIGQVSYGRG